MTFSPRNRQITGDSSKRAVPTVPAKMQTMGMTMGSRLMAKEGRGRSAAASLLADSSSSVTTLELWFTSFSSFQMPRS